MNTSLVAAADAGQLAMQCASALVLERSPISDLAALIDTALLIRHALPNHIDPHLIAKARRAAHTLGNHAAEANLLDASSTIAWHPLHPTA